MNRHTPPRPLLNLAMTAGAAALLVAGCATNEQIAPPVDVRLGALAEQDGYTLAQLETGRRIYLTDCVACHSPEPITRYSRARWDETLPRMARDARLDAEQEAAVTAYVRFMLENPRP